MSLRKYVEKRDFAKTPEPDTHARTGTAGARRFVVQKHAASHLHYDFRLEMGGALKSWAVPRGIPFTKGEKRLAMQVEDHPVSYREFEGIIPKGQYGGGTVMVWDYGTYQPLSSSPARDLAGGKLHFVLQGKKLSGEWYLVRLQKSDKEWLLIRGGVDLKPLSKRNDDASALSGKSMNQIVNGAKAWNSNRPETKSKRSILPVFEPMMARLLKSPPSPPENWQYEIKYDGFRALAFLNKGNVQLISRNGKALNGKFPQVVQALHKLPAGNTVLDGEIVAMDSKGRSSFQLLQAHELGDQRPLFYYIFDIPQCEGEDLRSVPLQIRQARLYRWMGKSGGALRLSKVLDGDGALLLKQAAELGLEGLIGKRKGSFYEAGRRSGAWIKLKTHREQEFVIGGYSDPAGGRHHFGALLIGVYQKSKLIYCGKVGTGFNAVLLASLAARFRRITIRECPFDNLSVGLSRAEMKHCHWLKPKLVCQVRFSEWTHEGSLRQPVFVGLREDKNAATVVREKAS